jgi:hypothetical protein
MDMVIFFDNLQNTDYEKLISLRDQNKIKNTLKQYIHLSLYALNIINIIVRDIYFDFESRAGQVLTNFKMELLNPDVL